ncbi:MAG: ribosome-recycling factor, partial [Bacteroidota bacterium]|nr:ribosome-recycling factor [Bacteroidota bacterium]
LSLPVLTEERRKELSKQAKAMCEQAKVNLRSARKDAMDAVKALGADTLSEDEVKDGEGAVQSSIDAANKTIDSIYQTKESEIMAV